MIAPKTVFKASPEALSTRLGADTVILNLSDSVYYGLDSVGSRVWDLLRTPVEFETICATIAAEYDVEAARCRDDVASLLHDLAVKKLIARENR